MEMCPGRGRGVTEAQCLKGSFWSSSALCCPLLRDESKGSSQPFFVRQPTVRAPLPLPASHLAGITTILLYCFSLTELGMRVKPLSFHTDGEAKRHSDLAKVTQQLSAGQRIETRSPTPQSTGPHCYTKQIIAFATAQGCIMSTGIRPFSGAGP